MQCVCVCVCVCMWLYGDKKKNWSPAADVLRESRKKEWSKLCWGNLEVFTSSMHLESSSQGSALTLQRLQVCSASKRNARARTFACSLWWSLAPCSMFAKVEPERMQYLRSLMHLEGGSLAPAFTLQCLQVCSASNRNTSARTLHDTSWWALPTRSMFVVAEFEWTAAFVLLRTHFW